MAAQSGRDLPCIELAETSSLDFARRASLINTRACSVSRSIGLGRSALTRSFHKRAIFTEKHLFGSKIPALLQENQYPMQPVGCDKVFALEWIDSSHALIGTKDNQIISFDTSTGDMRKTCVPCRTQVRTYEANGIQNLNPTEPSGEDLKKAEGCGVHSIRYNQDLGLVVSTAKRPWDISIIDKDSMTPKFILKGHNDWIFALHWYKKTLFSGSRDKYIGIWRFSEDKVKGTLIETETDVRELQLMGRFDSAITISGMGTVTMHDLESMKPTRRLALPRKEETVCMALQEKSSLLAVGSRADIQFFDPRSKEPEVFRIVNEQNNWGTRSLSWNGNVVTATGGYGRILFYDVRKNEHCLMKDGNNYIQCTPGWVREDEGYNTVFNIFGLNVPTAIYCHAYNPFKPEILCGGGPTQYGLFGSYVGLLQP